MNKTVSDWLEAEVRLDPELRDMVEEESLNADIATKVYNARKEAGLTQSQLADLIDTKQGQISRLEDADYKGHSLTVLKKVFAALGRKLVIGAPPKSDPSGDSVLSFGGRLRDYYPIVDFASQRICATFPAEILIESLVSSGREGLLEADRNYAGCKESFGDFSLPYAREAMLREIQLLNQVGSLKTKNSPVPIAFSEFYKISCKVPRKSVRQAVENFDQFHSVKIGSGAKGLREVLLFTKKKFSRTSNSVLLVSACQFDHELTINEAYRIDGRLHEGVCDMPPLQVLKALVAKFGYYIKVGRVRTQFIFDKTLRVSSFDPCRSIKIEGLPVRESLLVSWMRNRISEDGNKVADFAMAYCINTKKLDRWIKNRKR